MKRKLRFDEIGLWSEVKLAILKEYAAAYSRILSAQQNPRLVHVYIEGFAGSGIHLSRTTQEFVPGSPRNALAVEPPFAAYHLIDVDSAKAAQLKRLIGERQDVTIYEGDCNSILLERVFPTVSFRDYRRGLCILDPYGLHLDWSVIAAAGQSKAIDMFLNFPVADMNRNVLWQNPEGVDEADSKRMSKFWGDDTWREMAYRTDRNLFGMEEKVSNEEVVEAFRDRLRRVAGFARVPKPMPMRNSRGAVVYYLFPSLPRKKTLPKGSLGISSPNMDLREVHDVAWFGNRVDRCYVESSPRMHENQSRLQALLRGSICRKISRGGGSSV